MHKLILALFAALILAPVAHSQDLRVATVTRPPFSMPENGKDTGFSLDLWQRISTEIGRGYKVMRTESFEAMLDQVRDGQADLAIANISITSGREAEFDFSHPIFESGLQIMVPSESQGGLSALRTIFSPKLLGAVVIAMMLLFLAGMLMWNLERRKQPYFDLPARKAMFPAFWWALNLVVNGGFEERVPKSPLGRVFGVFLVISSLFIVSIFVANVTAIMTVDAISNNINSVSDLYGKRVGTTAGSTSSAFLEEKNLRHQTFADLDTLLAEFENGRLDAVVFDAPVLAYYVNNSDGEAMLTGPVIRRENYGIVLPTGSDLAEPINRVLLQFREDGTYSELYRKWFGILPGE